MLQWVASFKTSFRHLCVQVVIISVSASRRRVLASARALTGAISVVFAVYGDTAAVRERTKIQGCDFD